MTALEERLRGLADVEPAPAAPRSLADAALARAARRRRRSRARTLVGSVAVVAAIAVGVPQLAGPSRSASPATPDTPATSRTAGALPPRVNVLLLGSDAGRDREGVRIDSTIVASIDTRTGATVLVSLPRNLQHVPFRPGTPLAQRYPDGYACPGATADPCVLNDLWRIGEEHARDAYFRRFADPGRQAVIDGVEGVTGLRMDQVVLLDLQGFAAAVDAVGGVTVDVRQRLPIGGRVGSGGEPAGITGWIEPGRRHLDGRQALWFARSRSTTSDDDRMGRQRCLVSALVAQLDWRRLATSLPDIARAVRQDVSTTIHVDDMPAYARLAALVASSGSVRSLVLAPPLVDPAHPDLGVVRRLVADTVTNRTTTRSVPAGSRPAQDVRTVC